MSQIYKQNAGGGGGAVNSVTGLNGIQVNGVTGISQTGNVTVSNNFFSIFSPLIDFTIGGLHTLITPSARFCLVDFTFVSTDLTGFISQAIISIGNNNPTYDNLTGGGTTGWLLTNLVSLNDNIVIGPHILLASGLTINVNVQTPGIATTMKGYIVFSGFFI